MSLEKIETKRLKPKVSVGIISGLFHGDDGERVGLWHKAAEEFKKEQVKYVILLGGLVRTGAKQVDMFGEKTLNMQLKVYLENGRKTFHEANKKKPRGEKEKWTKDLQWKKELEFIGERARKLAQDIPVIDGIKIYIVTSPALDKALGRFIAEQLANQRKDIWLYGDGQEYFDLRQGGLTLGAFVPDRSAPPFRIKYVGAPIQGRLLDARKGPIKGLADINVVGGYGSAFFAPGDSINDAQKLFFSVPSLYSISVNRTAENQTGICILNVYDSVVKEAEVVNYSFKDLVSNEWKFIRAPKGTTRAQKAVIRTLKEYGRELTIGQLESFTRYSRDTLIEEIEGLKKFRRGSRWPGIAEKKLGDNRYFFNIDWVQEKARYTLPSITEAVDRFMLFSCLHAGCRWTDMRYFVEELAKKIIENSIQYLISAGDFMEGTFHKLYERGEIIGSRLGPVNNTYQETLAAWMTGKLIAKVFDERLFEQIPLIKSRKKARVNRADLIEAVKRALIRFFYIPGNHCKWTEYDGHDALSRFEPMLELFIIEHIEKTLWKAGLCIPGMILREIVREAIRKQEYGKCYRLPSGLTYSIFHPSLSRTLNASIRLQSALASSKALVTFTGNYHTAARLEEWDDKNYQRVGLEAPTLKIKSAFEAERLKTVDFGVSYLETTFARGQIVKTRTRFFGEKRTEEEIERDNNRILDEFEEWYRPHYKGHNDHK